jgi:hypothetical protein
VRAFAKELQLMLATLFDLVLLVILAAAYVGLNIALIWLLGRFGPQVWQFGAEKTRRAARLQLRGLSTARIWLVVCTQGIAMLLLFLLLGSVQSLLTIVSVMAGYTLVASGLCLSVLGQLPLVQALWRDPATRLMIWAVPVAISFVARGYASAWIGDVAGISAVNTPYALFVATALLASLCAVLLLGAVSVLFEIAMFFAPQTRGRRSRRLGLSMLAVTSFLSAFAGSQAAALPSTRLGGALISAVIFEFDAGPATPCQLSPFERKLAEAEEPYVKALYLASSQEKAVLIQREPALFRSFAFRGLTASEAREKRIKRLRTTVCFG